MDACRPVQHTRTRRRTATVLAALATGAVALAGTAGPVAADHDHHRFVQTNLVSDIAGLGAKTDAHLLNPWGVAFGPATPLWTGNEADGTSTLYRGTSSADVAVLPLVVKASSPTGVAFNPTTSFSVTQNGVTAPARFLFAETSFPDDPQAPPTTSITAWHNGTATVPGSTGKVGGFYSGITLVPERHDHGPFLLASDNAPGGGIDVYDGSFMRVHRDKKHSFVDPGIDAMKTPPYNVAYLEGRVYVAYAPPFGEPGTSAVSVFSASGRFRERLVTGHKLNGPFGMAIAPKHWGPFGRDLIVGNTYDGTLHAYDRHTGELEGTLRATDGKPVTDVGLWGIAFGNGVIGTKRSLVFAAGIGTSPTSFDEAYEHGLVGLIEPADD